MRKYTAVLLPLLMAVSLTACAGNNKPTGTGSPDAEQAATEEKYAPENNTGSSETESENVQANETEETADEAEEPVKDSGTDGVRTLVACFSATNTTKGVAEYVADGLGADLYEIVPEEPYTDADLNYNDDNSRSAIEMNNPSARPSISGSAENMEEYEIVFIGYPIWWGEAPRIVSTFMESYDFSGKTIVPFCTSGGSSIGSSAANLEELTDGAEWLSGQRLDGSSTREEIIGWINSLGLDVTAE